MATSSGRSSYRQDHSTFFSDTLNSKRVFAFYDFENEERIFPAVHHGYRFAITVISGSARVAIRTKFSFLTRHVADVVDRKFELAPDEVVAMNPNTGTLPMFRTRSDAEITLGIYRRHPVLIEDSEHGETKNQWHLSFGTLFHMTNDSHLFRQVTDLKDATFNGWSYRDGDGEYLPLYEAKMLSHFDHRFSTYNGATQAQLNLRSLPRISDLQHAPGCGSCSSTVRAEGR